MTPIDAVRIPSSTAMRGLAAALVLLASTAVAPAHAASETVLYSFTNGTDGSLPYSY